MKKENEIFELNGVKLQFVRIDTDETENISCSSCFFLGKGFDIPTCTRPFDMDLRCTSGYISIGNDENNENKASYIFKKIN